jgi:hypothetical protein
MMARRSSVHPAAVSVDVDLDALASLIDDLRSERSESSGASYAQARERERTPGIAG